MRKRAKLLALLLCAAFALVLFASSACLVKASGHCCEGSNCEICKTVLRLCALLRGMGPLAAAIMGLLFLFRGGESACPALLRRFFGGLTLVGWKVRLNN